MERTNPERSDRACPADMDEGFLASKLELIVLLYDGAIEFLQKAVFYMGRQDVAKRLHYISRATEIIRELLNALDMETGGQVARHLRELYVYMLDELTLANMEEDPERVARVQDILRVLREGWQGIK